MFKILNGDPDACASVYALARGTAMRATRRRAWQFLLRGKCMSLESPTQMFDSFFTVKCRRKSPHAYGDARARAPTFRMQHHARRRSAMSAHFARLTPLFVLLTIFACGCASGPTIRTDSDPSANLGTYKTFAFFDKVTTDKSTYGTILTSRLKASTKQELERRGLTQTTTNPQLLVNFNVNVQNRADVESTPSMGFYGYRAGMYGAWAGYPQDVHTTHYQEGTLAIDLVDAGKQQLVWQGVAEGRITKSVIENPTAAIDKAVADIFAKYPVAAAPTAP
jgi:Domain of unknown function (DUF4136)